MTRLLFDRRMLPRICLRTSTLLPPSHPLKGIYWPDVHNKNDYYHSNGALLAPSIEGGLFVMS